MRHNYPQLEVTCNGGVSISSTAEGNQPLCRAIKGVIKSMGWFSVPFRDDLQAYKGNITVFLLKQLLSSLILTVIITDFDCHSHWCWPSTSLMLTVIITDFDCHHHWRWPSTSLMLNVIITGVECHHDWCWLSSSCNHHWFWLSS
jgi:hypothetical protein